MGRDLAEAYPEARAVFGEVDDALGQPLSATMFEGPIETLTLTENAQPALMAVSLAVIRVLAARGLRLVDQVSYVAGHSLGEYSALAAAGSVSVADTARLLRIRGNAMQDAVPVGAGAMAAVIGLDFEAVADLAAEAAGNDVCEPANDNGGGQVVVSGTKAAVERAVELAASRGARRAVMLPVSAPFHCALMSPAAGAVAAALAKVTIDPPQVPVVANVSARPTTEPDVICRQLIEQVTGVVRWRETIGWLAGEGVTLFAEIGAGRVLSGLARRIAAGAEAQPVGKPEEIEHFLEKLG